jgi:hypothetical protein
VDEAKRSSLTLLKMMQEQLSEHKHRLSLKSSRNFLLEINIDSLAFLYSRSLIEYREFKTYFKEPLNFNIFTSDRRELAGICYQNNLTEQDYNLYEELLRKRIEQIQKTVESHFKVV